MTPNLTNIKLGSIVLFRAPKKQGETEFTDYPAIVYKLYPNEEGDHVGICVIWDGVPSRYGKVGYSKERKENHWSLLEGEY